jgi:hypothetical protein
MPADLPQEFKAEFTLRHGVLSVINARFPEGSNLQLARTRTLKTSIICTLIAMWRSVSDYSA